MPQNAIDLLEQEHREAEQLLAQLKGTKGENTQLLEKTAEELRIHMRIEEEVLYPFIRKNVPEGDKLMNEADKEHTEARQAIQETEQTAGTAGFEQALTTLTEGIQHHVKDEETKVFPKLRQTVDTATLEEFGAELAEAKQRIKAEHATPTSDKTRDELYAEAKEVGIEGRSKMDKDELAKAVDKNG
jgi:iron-sulfur cluster repair protein YtfE (RIC family)